MREPSDLDRALTPTAHAGWVITEDGCDPLREINRETRFAISNGFLGVRSRQAINRPPDRLAAPYTSVAGLFDTSEAEPEIPDLVPAPDWLQVRLSAGGRLLRLQPGDPRSHLLTLDLMRGLVLTASRHLDACGLRVALRMLRLVSLERREIGLQLIQVEIETGCGDVTLEAWDEDANIGLECVRQEQDFGAWRTRRSGKALAMAAMASLTVDGHDLAPSNKAPLRWSWTWRAEAGQAVRLQRMVAVTRSDVAETDPGAGAQTARDRALLLGWTGLLAEHEAAWADRWRCSDVEIDGDSAAQRALRFAAYHLNSAANPADERVSIGARALTGEDYRGHVFWDTEIFLLPYYALTWPEAARSLLMYRFHTLDGARAKAARMGWRGALYAWESADSGAEATPEQVIGPDRKVIDVLCGRQEQHISADVAYAVWQYWLATADEGFLLEAGAEILLETGRFWASRAEPGDDGRRHIRGVIGPDEYHQGVDDNAYTNVMARWNIRRALDVATLLRTRWPEAWKSLSSGLGLDDAELKQWLAVADTIATGFDANTGLFEQFAGFFGLEEIDLNGYAGRSVPMDVVLGRERTSGSQIVKQADVVALLALLPEEFPAGAGADNFRYYEPRCGHGSSLSRAMHGLVAARLGETEMALRYFRGAAATDLADTHVAIGGGVHIAALGGIWQMAVLGFAGLALRDDGVAIDPQIPAAWRSLGFAIQWRGRRVRFCIRPPGEAVEATLEAGAPMTLFLRGVAHKLDHDKPLRILPEIAAKADTERLCVKNPSAAVSAIANG